jgi:hypothetical protein
VNIVKDKLFFTSQETNSAERSTHREKFAGCAGVVADVLKVRAKFFEKHRSWQGAQRPHSRLGL